MSNAMTSTSAPLHFLPQIKTARDLRDCDRTPFNFRRFGTWCMWCMQSAHIHVHVYVRTLWRIRIIIVRTRTYTLKRAHEHALRNTGCSILFILYNSFKIDWCTLVTSRDTKYKKSSSPLTNNFYQYLVGVISWHSCWWRRLWLIEDKVSCNSCYDSCKYNHYHANGAHYAANDPL